MKHLQGEPLSEKLTTWAQGQRQDQQERIERALAKQLLQPLADIAPAFLRSPYTLPIISREKSTLTHEKNGMRFKSDELRPGDRGFLEQFQTVVVQSRQQNNGMKMESSKTGRVTRQHSLAIGRFISTPI